MSDIEKYYLPGIARIAETIDEDKTKAIANITQPSRVFHFLKVQFFILIFIQFCENSIFRLFILNFNEIIILVWFLMLIGVLIFLHKDNKNLICWVKSQEQKNFFYTFASSFLEKNDKVMTNVYNNILELIGNTPLVKLNEVTKDIPATVYAKLESFNPGH